ncbi:replication initiation protein [Clostridium gasigenes]|uniref:replication initiation protein n=1 Tax=Clostridium gasigenes TaxID=94869 RepID=UPI001C0DAB69|nr:replication initiation protein [Clostridium gasigenes]MBU3134534.1 replication initiation protein [Clostridium gasigenes]
MNNEILFKPNGLILATSNNTITSSEYKLYDTLLQRCQITKDSNWRKAEITRDEIQGLIKDKSKNNLNDLKKVLENFMNVKIRFKLGTKHVGATLLAEYVYDENTDVFSCSMSENVFTALMTYNEIGYSPIDLKMVRQARGFYTQKIYGLLRLWSRHNETINKTYTVEVIKDICDIFDGTAYDMYGNFKKKVLVPALKEINEKLNMKVEYKEIKKIRRVQEIEFIFTDYEPRKYDFEKDKLIEPKEVIGLDEVAITKDDIDSIDYMYLLDFKLNESIHTQFIKDFYNFKEHSISVQTASEKTLSALGGKTINKRNYKYFKTTLENLIPSIDINL